ncbi:GIY-YIG nuclease family protein [Streptomyces sp. NPDC046977]|uniref:GIY-YIG nuclease family protein n=1 Tax=Streptomyces sp. NPDC046977 TaxID=3154703 RepID=UPI0033E5A5EA
MYRCYDAADTLLYVGCSIDPDRRLHEHRRKDWWPQVTRSEVEWFDRPYDAALREWQVSQTENPLHGTPISYIGIRGAPGGPPLNKPGWSRKS